MCWQRNVFGLGRAPPCWFLLFVFCCEVCAFLSCLLYVCSRVFARCYEVLLSQSGRLFSHATDDVHFRKPHNTLKKSGTTNEVASHALSHKKSANTSSHPKKNYDHARDVAIVDKSYRRNSCLIPRHMTEMQREARKRKQYPIAWSNRHGQMENTKEPFPFRGHCWRAALLAVFRLIVVGFVSGCKLGALPIGWHEFASQS